MALKLNWPYKYRLLKVASDGKFGRLGPFDYYIKKGKKIKLPHQGSDYRIPCGIPFYSPVKGKIDILEKRSYGYGYFVRIKFGIRHIGFAHNSRLNVRLGQSIKVGQLLGLTGSTGAGSGCHSHVELRLHGRVINPETVVKWTVEDKMADAKTIFRNVFITVMARWPTTAEINAYLKSSEKRPYTYVQKKYLGKRYASRSAYNKLNTRVISYAKRINASKAQIKTLDDKIKGLKKDSEKRSETMGKQSLLLEDTRKEVTVLKEKLKTRQEPPQKLPKIDFTPLGIRFITWLKQLL